MTTKTIDSGISVKHAKNWTVSEALREVLQNYLDVRKEFKCTGSITWKAGKAVVKDGGPGLKIEHLAFGNNDKVQGSIGQFGEGLKSAFLTLIRNGKDIEIRTLGVIIRPVVQMSENFGVETLHYVISPMAARHAARLHGTVVTVVCSEEELNEGRSYFVELTRKAKKIQASSGKDFKWVERNRISLPGGSIYVNGSAIGKVTNAMFSYHLAGTEAQKAVNRDRSALDMTVVEPMVARLVFTTSSVKVMAEVLKEVVSRGSSFESKLAGRFNYNGNTRIWNRVWNRNFGKYTILSGSQDREAQYRGYRILDGISYDAKDFLMSVGVKTSSDVVSVRQERPSVGKIGARSLTTEEAATLTWARRIVRKFYADPGKVVVAENPGKLMNSNRNFDGVMAPGKAIYLRRGILENRERTLHVLLHETVHKMTGTDDCTSEFETALLDVAVKMLVGRK